jgi:hypothetical protein
MAGFAEDGDGVEGGDGDSCRFDLGVFDLGAMASS